MMELRFIELNAKGNKTLYVAGIVVALPRVGDFVELRSVRYRVKFVEFNLLDEKFIAMIRVFCRKVR